MTDHYSSLTLTVNETKELAEHDFVVRARRERWLGRCLKIPYDTVLDRCIASRTSYKTMSEPVCPRTFLTYLYRNNGDFFSYTNPLQNTRGDFKGSNFKCDNFLRCSFSLVNALAKLNNMVIAKEKTATLHLRSFQLRFQRNRFHLWLVKRRATFASLAVTGQYASCIC